jgi:hypothetical protein
MPEQHDFAFEVVRIDDGLVIRLALDDFIRQNARKLESVAGVSRVTLHLPPQHIAEETLEFDPNQPNTPPKAEPFAARAAAPSQLVFAIEASRTFDITARAILALCEEHGSRRVAHVDRVPLSTPVGGAGR